MFFDGSDVGLTTAGENVDGIEVGPDIRDIHFSTTGNFGVTAAPEPGEPDVLTGADEDVFSCRPQELPPSTPTECNWATVLLFDGSLFGLGPERRGRHRHGLKRGRPMQPHDDPHDRHRERIEDERAPGPQADPPRRAPARWRRRRRWRGGQRAGLDRARRGRKSARDGAARGAAPVSGSPLPTPTRSGWWRPTGSCPTRGDARHRETPPATSGDPGDGVYSFGFRGRGRRRPRRGRPVHRPDR